ncbi:MAG: hypothetical protein WCL02_06360 [bacterium]
MNKSMAYSIFPFSSALKKALEMIGSNLEWVASEKNKNKQQELLNLLKNISPKDCESLDMKTIGSYSADEINKFLADNGFDIQLDQLDPGGIGVASILKIFMSWVYEGMDCDINAKNGEKYKGVKMLKNIELFSARTYEENVRLCEIVCLHSAEGLNLYLTKVPFYLENEQDVFGAAKMFSEDKIKSHRSIKSVSFPEIEINCQPDISWLCGLNAGKDFISQALMQTKFKLDKHGAQAEAGVAIAVSRGISFDQIDIIFDEPFLAWIEKPGIEIPIFVSWCDYDSWKIVTR